MIIKVIKGIVFAFFILGYLESIFEALFSLSVTPAFALGQLIGTGLALWLIYYLLYKCKYKWIKKIFKKKH